MKVDLERLRESVRHVPADGWSAVRQPELEALLAVVDAARAVHGCGESDCPLCAALEPFTPPADRAWEKTVAKAHAKDRAWEEVDRWHAEQAKSERDRAVKAAVDATPKPTHFRWAMLPEQDYEPPSSEDRREWTRDYVALVGEVVQRQFRSDQERIAELETKVAEARKERDWARGRLVEYQGGERPW